MNINTEYQTAVQDVFSGITAHVFLKVSLQMESQKTATHTMVRQEEKIHVSLRAMPTE